MLFVGPAPVFTQDGLEEVRVCTCGYSIDRIYSIVSVCSLVSDFTGRIRLTIRAHKGTNVRLNTGLERSQVVFYKVLL